MHAGDSEGPRSECLQRAAWVTAPLARRELACMAAVISGAELEAKLAAAPSDAAQSLPGLLTSAGGLQGVASPPGPHALGPGQVLLSQ